MKKILIFLLLSFALYPQGLSKFPSGLSKWLPFYAGSSANVDTLAFYASLIDTNSNPPFRMSINASSVTMSLKGTGLIRVVWGDGSYSDSLLTSTAKSVSHTYSSSAARNVVIYNSAKITYFASTDGANYNFDWAQTNRMRLTYFACTGSNTLSGTLTLPSSMTFFLCLGSNTLSGTLTLPSSMTTFQCGGSNTLTGTLTLPSSMTYFVCSGSNTLTGTLTLPASMTYFNCQGSNTLNGYTTQTFNNNMNHLYLITTSGAGFSAAEVDRLIIDLDNSAWAGGSRTLRLTGSAIAPPTEASAAAITSLETKLVTVITN